MLTARLALLVASSRESPSLYNREENLLLLSSTRNAFFCRALLCAAALVRVSGLSAQECGQFFSQLSCWGALTHPQPHLGEVWFVDYMWLVKSSAATHFSDDTRRTLGTLTARFTLERNFPWVGLY